MDNNSKIFQLLITLLSQSKYERKFVFSFYNWSLTPPLTFNCKAKISNKLTDVLTDGLPDAELGIEIIEILLACRW